MVLVQKNRRSFLERLKELVIWVYFRSKETSNTIIFKFLVSFVVLMKFRISAKTLPYILGVFSLVVVSFTVGYAFASKGYRIFDGRSGSVVVKREMPTNQANVNFSLFWQVWDLLRSQYYDQGKIIDSNLVYGAVKGLVSAVGDPYTVFLTKEEQKVTEEDLSGSFDGIGIQIGYKGTQLAVIAPLPGTPAEKVGIQPGDLIIGIKDPAKNIDRSTDGMSLPEAVQTIRGPRGSKVTLALLRENSDKPLIIDVERQNIDVPSVTLKYVGPGESVAHLKIHKFGAETKSEWDKAILEILGKSNVKGIVLDVRSNPGGYLVAAVDVATEFLDLNDVVVKEESGGVVIGETKTRTAGRMRGVPVVVLINKGSASASEILAGALRDQANVKLVGEKSFGKGTVQEPREFPDGTGIHITIAKWLTPNGTWVHEKGLEPDVTIENDPKTEVDEQLESAVSLVD